MIKLDAKQQEVFNELIKKCERIESDLAITVDPNEPQQIQNLIERLRPFLSDMPMMLSDSSSLYDYAKGKCADLILANGKILNAKATIQKMWVDGQLEKINALFVRVDKLEKSLDKSISGLISLLSIEKEKIKHNIHQD